MALPEDGTEPRAEGLEPDPADVRIVTIDGPAGCGKSTVVRELADRLDGLAFSSGLIYRAVTWWVQESGLDPRETESVHALVSRTRLEIVERGDALRVEVEGRDPGDALHGDRVTEAIHWIADDSELRAALLPLQRRLPAGRVILAEGRDLGTVVFPDAPVKVFLTASLEERARRRHAEFRDRLGEEISLDEVEERLRRRDTHDSSRAVAPLRPAPDARVIDTTEIGPGAVVAAILEGIPRRWIPPGGEPRDGPSVSRSSSGPSGRS